MKTNKINTTCNGNDEILFIFFIIFQVKMYGLLLENISEYIKNTYGEDKWEEIRRKAAVEQTSFSAHQVYSESLIPRLAKSAMDVSNTIYTLTYAVF